MFPLYVKTVPVYSLFDYRTTACFTGTLYKDLFENIQGTELPFSEAPWFFFIRTILSSASARQKHSLDPLESIFDK
jgi:hypothetical protein